jgi:hypothetical protein
LSTLTRRGITAYARHEPEKFRKGSFTEQVVLLPTINLHQDVVRILQTSQLRCLSANSNAVVTATYLMYQQLSERSSTWKKSVLQVFFPIYVYIDIYQIDADIRHKYITRSQGPILWLRRYNTWVICRQSCKRVREFIKMSVLRATSYPCVNTENPTPEQNFCSKLFKLSQIFLNSHCDDHIFSHIYFTKRSPL